MEMQFSIVWVSAAIVAGFLFGSAIMFLLDKALMKKWRNEAVLAQFCVTVLTKSCRDVLSDSWYKKVMRAYKENVERMFAK